MYLDVEYPFSHFSKVVYIRWVNNVFFSWCSSFKSEPLLFTPVCPTLPRPRQPCSGKNAVGPLVSHSGSPRCWACACTEPDPWGQRRPEPDHRDHLRVTVGRTIILHNRLNPLVQNVCGAIYILYRIKVHGNKQLVLICILLVPHLDTEFSIMSHFHASDWSTGSTKGLMGL